MSKLALFNLCLGFWLLFLAAAAGAFIANDLTAGYIADKAFVETWQVVLSKSSHGHTNLFALIHIAFGLTLPYSVAPPRLKLAQTIGLSCGSFAMGPGMMLRAYQGPKLGMDPTSLAIGALLSAALLALFTHAAGLSGKLLRRV